MYLNFNPAITTQILESKVQQILTHRIFYQFIGNIT